MIYKKSAMCGKKLFTLFLSFLFLLTLCPLNFVEAEEETQSVAEVLQNDLANLFDYATQSLESLEGKVKDGNVLRIGTGSSVSTGEIWQNPENLKEGLTIDDLYSRIDDMIPLKDKYKGFGYHINSDYIQYILEQNGSVLKDYSTYETADEIRSAAYIINHIGAENSTSSIFLTFLELKAQAITNPNLTENDLNQVFGFTEEESKKWRKYNVENCPVMGETDYVYTNEAWNKYRQVFLSGFTDQLRTIKNIGCDKNDNIIIFADGTVEISKEISDRAFTIRRQLAALADSKAQYEIWTGFGEGSFYELHAKWFDFSITLFDELEAEIIEPPQVDFLKSAYDKNDNCGVASYFDHSYPTYGEDDYTVIFTGKKIASANNYIGYNSYDGHNGVDYHVRDCSVVGTTFENGKPIYVAADGMVLVSQEDEYPGEKIGYGHYVVIEHDIDHDGNPDYITRYAHLQEKSSLIIGNQISAGDLIGIAGNTGNSDGTHLHFHVRKIVYEKTGDEWERVAGLTVNDSIIDPFGWWGTEDQAVENEVGDVSTDPWETSNSYLSSSWLWKTSDYVDDSDDAFFAFNYQPYPWQTQTGSNVLVESGSALYTFATFEPTKKWSNWGFWGGKVDKAGRYNVEVHIPDLTPQYVAKSRIDSLDLTTEQKNIIWEFNSTHPDNAYEQLNYKAEFKVANLVELESVNFWTDLTQEQQDAVLDIWNNRVSTEANYFVYHNGEKTEVLIDPTQVDSTGWISLGNYYFDTGTNQAAVQLIDEVQTSENAGKIIWADAVRWTSVNMPQITITQNGRKIENNDTENKVDFGLVDLGESNELEFTLTNDGGADLEITEAILLPIQTDETNTQLEITQMPDSIVAGTGGTTTFKVKYTPTGNGSLDENARLNLNFGNEGVDNFTLYFKGGNGNYNDVPTQAWYRRYVRYLNENNVVDDNPYGDNTYRPAEEVTRAEVLKMAYTGKEIEPIVTTGASVFVDVDNSGWYYKYVRDAKNNGYVEGKSECVDAETEAILCQATEEQNCFCPNEAVTRYEAAKIVHAVFTDTDYSVNDGLCAETENYFADVNRLDWFCQATSWLKENQAKWKDSTYQLFADKQSLADGYDNGYFAYNQDEPDLENDEPKAINRAEMAKIVANAMNFSGSENLLPMSLQEGELTLQAEEDELVTLGKNYEQTIDETNETAPGAMTLSGSSAVTISETEILDLDFETHDADGDEMFYVWNATGGIFTAIDDVKFSHITWTPPDVEQTETFIITATRGDGRGLIGEGRFEITVEAENNGTSSGSIVLVPTIHAKSTGGYWNSASTWEEGRIPNENDVVEINGSVNIDLDPPILTGLLIQENSILQNLANRILTVSGSVVNYGTIQDNPATSRWGLMLEVGGNIVNYGLWQNIETKQLTDLQILNTTQIGGKWNCNGYALDIPANQFVTFTDELDGQYPGEVFVTNPYVFNGSGTIIASAGATGNVFGTISELQIKGENIELASNIQVPKIVLAGTGTVNISNAQLSGDLEIGSGTTVDAVGLSVNGRLTNYGVLQNPASAPYLFLENYGDLINYGLIHANSENANVYLINTGNVINNGVIQNDYANTNFMIDVQGKLANFGEIVKSNSGAVLQVGVGSEIENEGIWQISELFLPGENSKLITSTQDLEQTQVITEADLELRGKFVLGGKMVLENYNLTINSPSEVTLQGLEADEPTIYGNGKIRIHGDLKVSYLQGNATELSLLGDNIFVTGRLMLPKVVFEKNTTVLINGGLQFFGDLYIESGAIIQNQEQTEGLLIVFGNLYNFGTIQSSAESIYLGIGIFGDVVNQGVWNPAINILGFSMYFDVDSFEFQMTDENGIWQEIESNDMGMKQIFDNTLFDGSHLWRTREIIDGVAGDWTTHKINKEISQIVTASGGTVTLTNSSAGVEFLENSTSQDLNINITELDDTEELPATEANYALISSTYEFTATNSGGTSVTSFDDDVTITLSYDSENLGEVEELSLKINYYDEENEVWVPLTSVVDTVNQTVTAQTNHFTKYAVIGNVIQQITFSIEDAEGNQVSGAKFSLDDETWQNFPATFDLPYYTQSYDFEFGDYQFHHLFRFLQGYAYQVNLITGEIIDQTSSTGTSATFVLDTTEVVLKVVDQNYVEIPEAKVGIKGIIDLYPNGSGFTLVNNVERQYTYSWRGEFYQPEFALEKGKINRWQGGTLTKIDSGSGETVIEFVLPTLEVSVNTVNSSGANLNGTFSVHSLDDEVFQSGESFLMANGGKTHFYGTWNDDTITILNLQINKGKLYQIDTVTEEITTTDIGGETARVEFVYDVIPVVVKNIDKTGTKIGGTVQISKVGAVSYASGKTYDLANGSQISFRGVYDGESRSNSGFYPLTIEEGKTYRINSYNDTTIAITDSPDGLTYVELQFSVISVICRTVDQYGNNKGGGQFKFDDAWKATGYTFTMAAATTKYFKARFDVNMSTVISKSIKVYKGKLHTVDTTTKALTVTDSPDGQTRVEFVFPTVKVKVSTWNSSGNEVSNAYYKTGTWTSWTGAGRTINVKEGESNLFYNKWNGTTFSKTFIPQEGKIYEISSSGITTTNAGTGVTLSEVRFLH